MSYKINSCFLNSLRVLEIIYNINPIKMVGAPLIKNIVIKTI